MSFFEFVLLAVSLSMDAFAVSICRGLALKQCRQRDMLIVGFYFGLFQAIMPFLGWIVGSQCATFMETLDGIIPPLVLGAIGFNMIKESREKEDEETPRQEGLPGVRIMLALALATSIDAFAVGVTFVVLRIDILPACIGIGTITCFFSSFGVQIGHLFGLKYKAKAEVFGGIVLIGMALRFFVEDMPLL